MTTPQTTPPPAPKIIVHSETAAATGIYRCSQPAQALAASGRAVTKIVDAYLGDDELQLLRPDVVVFRHPFKDEVVDHMRRYRRVLGPGVRVVWDTDDILWKVPAHNPFAAQFPANTRKRLRVSSRLADVVTVSTARLGQVVVDELGVDPAVVSVVRNHLTSAFVNAARAGGGTRTPMSIRRPRVGWAGGSSHAMDLAILAPVVAATTHAVDWVFMGAAPEGVVPGPGVDIRDAVGFGNYAQALGAMNLDLAVAPLEDSDFNVGKSDLRLLELMATGACVLASSVPAFVDGGAPVEFVAPGQWVQRILELVADPETADAAADRQHRWLLANRVQDLPEAVTEVYSAWTGRGHAEVVATDYVYVREGTTLSPTARERLVATAHEHGAACAVSNDGDYPLGGQFVPLSPATAELVAATAATAATAAPVAAVPHLTGPAWAISAETLTAVGGLEPGDPEIAAIEWGNRARSLGVALVQDQAVFAVAADSRAPSGDALQQALVRAAWWYPQAAGTAVDVLKSSAAVVAGCRAELDCRHFAASRVPAEGKVRLLLVNADDAVAKALAKEGHVPLTAAADGPWIRISPEYLPNVAPSDCRRPEDVARTWAVLGACGVDVVVLCGLGAGDASVLGALAWVHEHGIRCQYEPVDVEAFCPRVHAANDSGPCGDLWRQEDNSACQACVNRCGSVHGYVDVTGYRRQWMRFLETTTPVESLAVDAPTPAPAETA